MWCDRGQEAFVNVDLFQTTTNYSSFISLWPTISFYRMFLFEASSHLSEKYVTITVESKQGILI